MRIRDSDGERTASHPNASNIHQPLIDDVAHAVLENRAPIVTSEIGRMVSDVFVFQSLQDLAF